MLGSLKKVYPNSDGIQVLLQTNCATSADCCHYGNQVETYLTLCRKPQTSSMTSLPMQCSTGKFWFKKTPIFPFINPTIYWSKKDLCTESKNGRPNNKWLL
jgi:hypothetical protein